MSQAERAAWPGSRRDHFRLGFYTRNFSPVSEMNLKGPKILGTSYGANFEKQRKHR